MVKEIAKSDSLELKEELNSSIVKLLEEQGREQKSIDFVSKAFLYAYEKHLKQKRKSGELYIVHPVAVAKILISLKCDTDTICAGLLHDVLEDTDASKEDLIENFNQTVSDLVEGVTKLGKLNFRSSEEAQANNFRKMLLAIAQDMRVVLVKLADRLTNMQTISYLDPTKQKRIAQETLDIFAPLANRFGLGAIKSELEDLSFKTIYSNEFGEIQQFVKEGEGERKSRVDFLMKRIKDLLEENNISADVYGRAKHFYSIFRKIKRQLGDPSTLEQLKNGHLPIYDLLGVRVLVNSIRECYEVLGIVHDAFRPMPGRFKDYIAVPKSNLYQSLHTTVIGPSGRPIEIQIRTHKMHEIAENGIAAHWNYKESGSSSEAKQKELEQLTWLRQLVTWHTDLQDAEEYLDTVKVDIFSQEVYILSPKGDVYTLPAESTPVDFAYRVHTQVGDTCSGAIVNEKIVPLSYKLQNGDLVEVITNKNSHPNINWLSFVKTNQAKHKIKSWYKKQNRDLHISTGRQLLEEEFTKDKIDELLKSEELKEVAVKLNCKTIEDLLAALGSGDNSVAQVRGRLKSTKFALKPILQNTPLKPRKASSKGNEADIPDLDGLLYHIAKCCHPVPGEEVVGLISRGRGIVVHRADCINIKQSDPERIININWNESTATKAYPANLVVEVFDRVGVVRDILSLVADEQINIKDFKVTERPNTSTALLKLMVEVNSQAQLKKLSQTMKGMSDVLKVERT